MFTSYSPENLIKRQDTRDSCDLELAGFKISRGEVDPREDVIVRASRIRSRCGSLTVER